MKWGSNDPLSHVHSVPKQDSYILIEKALDDGGEGEGGNTAAVGAP